MNGDFEVFLKSQREERRRRFASGLSLWALASPILSILSGWWMLDGDPIMKPVFFVSLFATCALWTLRIFRPRNPWLALGEARLRDYKSHWSLLGTSWTVALVLGLAVWKTGFQPRPILWMLAVPMGGAWAVALAISGRVASRWTRLLPSQSLLILAIFFQRGLAPL
jgi:hypothetical protein